MFSVDTFGSGVVYKIRIQMILAGTARDYRTLGKRKEGKKRYLYSEPRLLRR